MTRQPLRQDRVVPVLLCLLSTAVLAAPTAAQSQPEITIAAGTSPVTEGTAATFTVSANSAPNSNLTVNLTVTDLASSDFVASAGEGAQTVTILASATSATYSVATELDDRDEASGPVAVTVAAGGSYSVGSPSSATVRVLDDDPTNIRWNPDDFTALEGGTSGTELGAIDVSLRWLGPGETLALPLEFAGGRRGTDFALSLGVRSGTLEGVTLLGDTVSVVGRSGGTSTQFYVYLAALADMNADDETVTVSLGKVVATGLDGGVNDRTDPQDITLVDQSPVLAITARSSTVTEGSSAQFRISLVDGPRFGWNSVTLSLTVADAPGSDFVDASREGAKTATLTASGQRRTDYNVNTEGDGADEPNGPVTVTLNRTSEYEVRAPATASVLVRDDDGSTKPEITIAAGTSPVTEGTAATFTVSADSAPTSNLTVDLTVADAPGADFVASTGEGAKTVTIMANTTSANYSVATSGDGADEPSGPVTVTLAAGSTWELGSPASASVTVNDDDDTTVTLATPDRIATEGDELDPATMRVTLSRGLVSGERLVVPLTFAGGARNTDFSLVLSTSRSGVTLGGGSVVFNGPVTAADRVVNVLLIAPEDTDLTSETITVSLGTLTATGLDGTATGSRSGSGVITLVDNDADHVLSVRVSAAANEGDAGTSYREVFFDVTPPRAASFHFKVCLSGDAQRYLTTADQQAGLAQDYDMYDFNGGIYGSVGVGNPAAGHPEGCTNNNTAFLSNKRYFIGVAGDNDIEADETVTITLMRGTGSKAIPSTITISSTAGAATYTIRNDDSNEPEITISAGTSPVTEGTAASFTVSANPAPGSNLPVDLTVADAPNADFVAAAGEDAQTVTIQANMTSASYSVTTSGDDADEPSGAVTVTVADGTGYGVGSPGAASVTVNDDDTTTVTLSGLAGDVTEGGGRDIVLTLDRGLVQGETLTAPLTFGGEATRNTDYTLACPSPLPSGVTCANLNSGNAEVAFNGPSSGTTAAEVAVTLTAAGDGNAESPAETVVVGLGTLSQTGLDGGASGSDNLADFAIADPPTANADGDFPVSAAWTLKPAAIAASGKFRLLFVTSTKRNAQSTDIADYNSHAQAAADIGHAAIRPYRNEIRAVASTSAVDARDNTATTGTGVPIYWLNGDIAADDYGDFYDGSWDNRETSHTRNQNGVVGVTGLNQDGRIWTGTTDAGIKEGGNGPLGVGSHSSIGDIFVGQTRGPLDANFNSANNNLYKLYALSPVFVVEAASTMPVANFASSSSNPTESAGTHNVAVDLNPAPQSGITLNYVATGTATAGTDYTTLSGSVSVAAGATSVNIPVAITDDTADDDDETVVLTLGSGTGYTAGSTNVHTVTIQDNDEAAAVAGVATSREVIVLDEGAPAETYTVKLTKAPAANVTVTGTVREPSVLAVHKTGGSPGSSFTLTFTSTNWNQPQPVTMTPLEDPNTVDDVTRITHVTTGTGEYANIPDHVVIVTVDDNDLAVTKVVTIAATANTVTEGAAATFTVSSNPAPTVSLVVNLSVADAPDADFVAGADEGDKTVTIPANARTATYTVPTTADEADETDGPVTVTVTQGNYDAGTPNAASTAVRDNDPTTVLMAATSGSATEGSAADPAGLIVTLGRELFAGEVLAVPLTFTGGVRNTDFTLEFDGAAPNGVSLDWTTTASSTVTFTGPAASEASFVLTALADGDAADDVLRVSIPPSSAGGSPRLTATNLGGGARGIFRTSWRIDVADDDAAGDPGIVESAGRLNLVEGGAAGSYTVRLRSAPPGAVTVTATSGDPNVFRVHAAGGAPGAEATLTFDPANWNRPQRVTVTARQDADADDALLAISHAVTGTGEYAGLDPVSVAVFVVDDEGDTITPPPPPPPPPPPGPGGGGGGGGGAPSPEPPPPSPEPPPPPPPPPPSPEPPPPPPPPPPPEPPPPPPPPPEPPLPPTGPPAASFTVAGAECDGEFCVTFTGVSATLSNTSSGAVTGRAWNTGDGRRSTAAVLRHAWAEPGYYRVTLRVSGGGRISEAHRTFLVRPAAPAGRCVPNDDTRCLLDERYRLRIDWWSADGASGPARVVREGTDDSALFHFFDPNNWEFLVKVLDGCAINGRIWVFGASATDLGYEVVVTDTAGADPPAVYRNEPGTRSRAFTDTSAFPNACAR